MIYNKIYKTNNVWGNKPNKLLQSIWSYYNPKNIELEFLDLGCGQGRDSLFMLQKGFKVTAIDNSFKGIENLRETIKTKKLPKNNITLLCSDMKDFKIEKGKYAIISAFTSLQFLSRKDGLQLIERIKKNILPRGFIIVSGFTIDDPGHKDSGYYFKPQELRKLFVDFDIIFYREKEILDKGHISNPKPHKHSIVEMIARKN